MAAALALLQAGDPARELYLFDTYEGMSTPTVADKEFGEDEVPRQSLNAPRVPKESQTGATRRLRM